MSLSVFYVEQTLMSTQQILSIMKILLENVLFIETNATFCSIFQKFLALHGNLCCISVHHSMIICHIAFGILNVDKSGRFAMGKTKNIICFNQEINFKFMAMITQIQYRMKSCDVVLIVKGK